MNQLIAKSIYKSFGDNIILNNFSINLDSKQKMLLLGPNGIGKTTLLKSLAGHLPIDRGEIQINSRPLDNLGNELRNNIVYISSRENGLYPHLTIKQNISLLATAIGLKNQIIQEKIDQWMSVKVFKKALPVKFFHCSKGMKQIALLFCQTMASPKIILLDEPFACLDEENKKSIHMIINELFKESAIFLATHDKESPFLKDYKIVNLLEGKFAY